MNKVKLFFVSVFSVFLPAISANAITCSVNGKEVVCPEFINIFGSYLMFGLLFVVILILVSIWKIFTKANQPGWVAIVPIYNTVVMLQIVRKPIWWILLLCIPFVNIIIGLIMTYELVKVFGKGFGFMLGLIFLPIIFYPILAFGKSTYVQVPQS